VPEEVKLRDGADDDLECPVEVKTLGLAIVTEFIIAAPISCR
jgi:hypothetical protein